MENGIEAGLLHDFLYDIILAIKRYAALAGLVHDQQYAQTSGGDVVEVVATVASFQFNVLLINGQLLFRSCSLVLMTSTYRLMRLKTEFFSMIWATAQLIKQSYHKTSKMARWHFHIQLLVQ